MSTFVIAEAAACHDGSWDKAQRLIDLAQSIGANAVKFQWLSSPERLVERRKAAVYLAAYRNLAFPLDWHGKLKERCQAAGLEYLCTVYLPEDVAVVAPYVSRFKIASFEARDLAFFELHPPYAKPIIVSTGFGYAPRRYNFLNAPVAWLHCVSAYPCPLEDINLRVLHSQDRRGRIFDGLSDHTKGSLTGALAVAAGAQIIEFHVRLDDTAPTNADYEVARTAAEAAEYVRNIRYAERLMGDGGKRPMPSEMPLAQYVVGGTEPVTLNPMHPPMPRP